MCGIFGYYKAETLEPTDRGILMSALALYNDERGAHSHGWWAPGVEPRKALGPILRSSMVGEMARHGTAIAHTRFATVGQISVENTHPFTIGATTGAHNGSIWNRAELSIKYPGRGFPVDSMHLIAHIDQAHDTADLIGYGTVFWTRRGDTAIYFGTFCGGELAVARIKDSGYVWSSDEAHLRTALSMTGLKYKIKHIRPGTIYVFAGGVLQTTCRRLDVKEQRIVSFKPKEVTAVDYGYIEKNWREPMGVDDYMRGGNRKHGYKLDMPPFETEADDEDIDPWK